MVRTRSTNNSGPISAEDERAHEIPRERWRQFLDRFSVEHLNATACVEVRGTEEGGSHHLTHHMPLMGISADLKDNENMIEVMLGDGDELLTHMIAGPLHVWARNEDSEHATVQIEGKDGTVTLVQL